METVEYKVILRTGPDRGKELVFRDSDGKIYRMFKRCRFTDKEGYTSAEMGHIAGNKRGEPEDTIRFNINDVGSVVLTAKNKRTANRCLDYWRFEKPFYRRK
jgi:hypothetical protein